MTAIGIVQIRLAGPPPTVSFARGEGVGDEFWYALPLRLGAHASRERNRRFLVPVERFLAARLWLRDHCLNYRVGLDLDGPVRDLLRRSQDEQRFLLNLLDEAAPALDVTARLELLKGRKSRFSRSLRQFQKRDLAKLLGLCHGANFSVPGAGKTAVTYAVYEAGRVGSLVERMLVVAPLSAFETWETEAQRCFDIPPVIHRFDGSIPWDSEVLLVNYQKLKEPYFERLTAWALERRTQIVLDEAHRMKRGQYGEWGRACLQLAHVAARRDILTGTPAPHSPRDFIALLDFLWPNQARRILPTIALHRDPLPGALQVVSDALAPLFVRTTKSELG